MIADELKATLQALEEKTAYLEGVNKMAHNLLKVSMGSPSTSTWTGSFTFNPGEPYGEGAFDPESVDWATLMKLYQDDPLLMAIFDGMKEYTKRGRFWTTGSHYSPHVGTVTSSTGTSSYATVYSTSATSSGNVSPSPTFTIDGETFSGTMDLNVTYNVDET